MSLPQTTRLLSEVKGIVADIKQVFFKKEQPLNDNDIEVHRLCVHLEKLLRAGAREKYSFTGSKKDYWNFISDSLSKDEMVKFVNGIADFRTNQGKGRGLLRQALMEQSLADTIQRCAINEKIVRDYYTSESIIHNKKALEVLMNCLYDLNAVAFHLPYKGYDLDRSWPSFSRKAFHDSKRRLSSSSLLSQSSGIGEDSVSIADPLQILHSHINRLDSILESWDGNYKSSASVQGVSIERAVDKLMSIHAEVIKLKVEHENLTLSAQQVNANRHEADDRLQQIQERYSHMQKLSSSVLGEQVTELSKKLTLSEQEVKKLNESQADLKQKFELMAQQLKDSKERRHSLELDLKRSVQDNDETNNELEMMKHELSVKSSLFLVKERELEVAEANFEKSNKQVVHELKREFQNKLNSEVKTCILCEEKLVKLEHVNKKLETECEFKEGLEKTVDNLQRELVAAKEATAQQEQFLNDVYDTFELNDSVDGKNNLKISMQEATIKMIRELREEANSLRASNIESDANIIGMKYELSSITRNFTNLQTDHAQLVCESESLVQKLKVADSENVTLKEHNRLLGEQIKVTATNLGNLEDDHLLRSSESETLTKEVQSLRFQLNTEEIKHNSVKNKLERLTVEYENFSDLSARSATQLAEEHQFEIAKLKRENEDLKNKNDDLEVKLNQLQEDFDVVSVEREEQRALSANAWNRLNNCVAERKEKESEYETQITLLQDDMKEIKIQLVSLTRDKQELWEQKDALEFTLRCKTEDRWMKDGEVEVCTECFKAFSLTMRKHHCRLCGGIFCSLCSSNWLKTQHSRKKVRSCNNCATLYMDELDGGSVCDGGSVKTLNDSTISKEDLSGQQDSFSPALSPFEMLNSSDVTSSGHFGDSELIVFLEKDVEREAIEPVPGDTGGEFQVKLPPGIRYRLPVIVESNEVQLIWRFDSTPQDVGFGIAFRSLEDDAQIKTVIPLSRYVSHKQTIHGKMRLEKAGVYYLMFNNSYSKFTAKNVTGRVGLELDT